MLEGLEAVEMNLSKVKEENLTFRFDSEFFKKEYLKFKRLLKPLSKKLNYFLVNGQYGTLPKSNDYVENGLPLIRGKDLRNSYIDIKKLSNVPYNYYEKKYKVKEKGYFNFS